MDFHHPVVMIEFCAVTKRTTAACLAGKIDLVTLPPLLVESRRRKLAPWTAGLRLMAAVQSCWPASWEQTFRQSVMLAALGGKRTLYISTSRPLLRAAGFRASMEKPIEDERLEVVSVRTRPDLLPIIAEWLWHQWWKEEGRSLEETQAIYAECCKEVGAPQTLILLANNIPIATVTLARKDLDERPTLTPWLAGVCVTPARRGKGYIYHLLEAFDAACRQASVKTAWLLTNTAESVYLRAGWHVVEIVERPGKLPVTLMSRDYV